MKKNCAVLVPIGRYCEPGCEEGLQALAQAGYTVRRYYGYSDVARSRSAFASDALADGFTEIMWIDSDILFDPADLDKLRAHKLPVVGGIYAKKGIKEVCCKFLPGTAEVIFGAGGGLCEVQYLATGFLLTHRDVYTSIIKKDCLPRCWNKGAEHLYPFFLHEFPKFKNSYLYLGEDYSFCERARRAGFKIMADTSIRLGHIGSYAYTWDDVLRKNPGRPETVKINLKHR